MLCRGRIARPLRRIAKGQGPYDTLPWLDILCPQGHVSSNLTRGVFSFKVTKMARIKYIIPSLITAASLAFGLLSIRSSVQGNYIDASWLIVWTVLLDKLDGSIASYLDAKTRFGNYFDSISDFVSFGAAPSFLAYRIAMPMAPGYKAALMAASVIFMLSSGLRLLNFSAKMYKFEDFWGIPTTLSASLLAPYMILILKYGLGSAFIRALPFILVALGILMNSKFVFARLKKKKSRGMAIFQFVLIVLVYSFGILRIFPEFLMGCAVFYLFYGIVIFRLPKRLHDALS